MGSLKAKDYDDEAENGEGADIKWCKRGEYIISLGVPIGWDHSEEEFWWTKYRKCKSYIAHWHDVERMSPYGKSLLANACVYGRFRYWAMCMRMPTIISEAITADVQALIWGKDLYFDPDEAGMDSPSHRWISNLAQYNPRREGGLGALHWPSHIAHIRDWLQPFTAAFPNRQLIHQQIGAKVC